MNARQRTFLAGATLALVMFAIPQAWAQFTANNQTNIISGVTSNWVGSYIVGSNTFADALLIQDGGVLTNLSGYIGYEIAAGSNAVVVSGMNSVWYCIGDLYPGYNGPANRMIVTNGGAVFDDNSEVVSDHNTILVTDAGSVWSNRFSLNMGGVGGSLTITNGGAVYNEYGTVGTFYSNNVAVVTGTGSIWSSTTNLYVGDFGSSNVLIIRDGGIVFDSLAYIGANTASNNAVMVTGTGSVWSNRIALEVGYGGTSNKLKIRDNGQVASSNGYIGANSSASSNNVVLVTGTGALWRVGHLEIGAESGHNALTITNGGAVYDSECYVGKGLNGTNTVLVTGSGSVWSNSSYLYIGYLAPSNTLTIADHATVWSAIGNIGQQSAHNAAWVTESGSVWSNGYIYVGAFEGSCNSLIISNGGQVVDFSGTIGSGSTASNNVATVTGIGSAWRTSGGLYVGDSGSGNQLIITDSGTVVANALYVGYKTSSKNNLIGIAGGELYVTNAAHTAVLDVRCGRVTIDGGWLEADVLIVTNPCGTFIESSPGTVHFGELIYDPNSSATGDGIPNWWKVQYGLDLLSTNGINNANADPDGDGRSNLQEYLAGTDPTNSASFFGITAITNEGNNIRITWMTGSGKTNALERSVGDENGSYSNNFVDVFIITNTSSPFISYLDVGGATNLPARYYRVRLIP
ncbi:MAG TPA: hypothetical protein VL171_00385 [Verrucomicrobiae bacterium]|nr:hypothetical protein [Verrucomicrobiae bacterium]